MICVRLREGCVEDILAKNYVLFFIECPFSLLGILCSMMSE